MKYRQHVRHRTLIGKLNTVLQLEGSLRIIHRENWSTQSVLLKNNF